MGHRRVTTAEDIALVASLAEEIWREHFPRIITDAQIAYMLEKYQSERAIAEQVSAATLTYDLLTDGDEACGYCAYREADDGLFLSKLYVRMQHRGKGLARAAIERFAAAARALPRSRIWLTCNKHNDVALAAYARLGFETVDAVVTDIGDGFVMDDYILEKRF
jgi:ribosomal protein S18 acetylase RimI-like enzyme